MSHDERAIAIAITWSHKDITLAHSFTSTSHTRASAATDPETSHLPSTLNVLIIGASQGIGAGIAHAYAKSGVGNLILAARATSRQKLQAVEQTAKELAPAIRSDCFDVDITNAASVSQLAEDVKAQYGRLDILVLNSGYSGPVVLKVDEGNPRDFQDVFDVNIVGTYNVAHCFVPLLKESDGAKTFIAVGSFAALITNGHIANTAYCISKFAQARFVEFLSEQYAADGILAIAVHPGAVNTEMADQTTPESFRPCRSFVIVILEEHITDLSRSYRRRWLVRRLLRVAESRKENVAKRTIAQCAVGRQRIA
jgi:NAD(P)-dependent dehydrogenase (short-subunit alcohol dehydrogenase family)